MKNAARYAAEPSHSTVLKPVSIASKTASRGASTEKQPLMAHAHGMQDSSIRPRTFSPVGKGMPIRIPGGMKMKKTEMIFACIEYEEIALIISGRNML